MLILGEPKGRGSKGGGSWGTHDNVAMRNEMELFEVLLGVFTGFVHSGSVAVSHLSPIPAEDTNQV